VTVLLALAVNHAALSGPTPSAGQTSAGQSPTGQSSAGQSSAALGPVEVAAPPSSAAAARGCPAVISHLPVVLDGRQSRPAQSVSPYVAAWGDPPVVLRCGVPRPAAFVQTAELTVVNGVQWLAEPRKDATVWTAVDREVYVEVTVPAPYSGAAVVDLSAALTQALPARHPSPARG
jgi:Protein of unknown function (DUF3515)